MGKMQRAKGSRVEREIVNLLKADGIDACRVPLSGAVRGFKGDIHINVLEHEDTTDNGVTLRSYRSTKKRVEVKARRDGSGFSMIERWLSDSDYLFLKRDRQEPMVVMNFNEFKRLIK